MKDPFSRSGLSKVSLNLTVFTVLLFFCNNLFAANKTWTGATSTSWATASNWSPAVVPASNDVITIPVRPNMPIFSSGTSAAHSIIIQSGASLTQTGGTLSVNGASIQISGTFNQTGGSLYTSKDFKVLTGGVFNQSGTGLVHLAKNAATLNPVAKLKISTGGTINQSGGTFYAKDYDHSPGTFNQTGSTALFKLYRDWKPGAGSRFLSTAGTVQFTGDGDGNFASGTRQFNNVIVDAGVEPKFDDDNNSIIPISGNFTNNNTSLDNGTKATFIFNGSGTQNIYSAVTGTSNTTFGNLIINKPSGSAVLTSNANIKGNMSVLSGTYDLGTYTSNRVSGGGTLTVSAGATMRLAATTGGQTGSNFPLRLTPTLAKTSTVEYYGGSGTQTIYPIPTYGNVTLSGAGTKTASAALNVTGNFTHNTGTFVGNSHTHNIGGNWSMGSGTFTNTGSTINLNGTGPQTVSSTGAFNRLTINKASGTTTLASDVTVNTALTFTKGVLATETNKIIIPSGGTVTGASQSTGWVNGNLQKYIPTIAGTTYDIGGPLFYTPVTQTFSGSFTAGSLMANAKSSNHANINSSTLAAKNISANWSVSAPATGALAFTKTDLAFSWNAANNYAPMIAASLDVAQYNAGTWSYPALSGTPTATTITARNLSNVGDFAIGEISACTITSAFAYPLVEICSNSGLQAVTLNIGATSGVYTALPAGLSINATTGTINPGASMPGIYTITNTVIGACTSTSSTTVQIIAAPTATISYGGTTFCQSALTASVTFSGTTGGTFSSTYGLVIDDVTGQVDLDDSEPGTYTVTYSVNTVPGCAAYSTTASITVTLSNYANIAYLDDAYCSNGGIAAVDFDGTVGGVFSSSAGLTINSSTGAITLGSSTPGTYTVTYTGGAANGCAAFTGTATITITSSAPGTVSYPGTPFCASGTATPTITGQTGGLFSSTAGLSIDETSGEITLDSSIAGTYVVTYSFGGCYATTSVTVSPPASITYPAATSCINTGTYSVTRTGTSGGTYSSDAGLWINTGTGEINAALSTIGMYTVTYTVPVVGGCPSYQVTTTTSIGIGGNGIWSGAISTAWENPANWQCHIIPVSTTNVTIPTGLTNYPVITAITPEINNLTLQSGATVTVTNGTFKIRGTFSNSGGYINAISGKIECSGTVAQTIPASLFYLNVVRDLVITNPAGVTLGGTMRVTNSVGFGNVNNTVLTTGGFLTLVSTSSNTANVLDITNAGINSGNSISGNVTVERFVQGKRSYRFLTAPVNSAGSIRTNWMENTNNTSTSVNNNPVLNYGTHITGIGGSTNGFDATNTNNPSLFTFNATTQAWNTVGNTSGVFAAGNGYRVMVRGSRSVDLNNNEAAPSVTTLRATGTLVTGPVTMARAGGGGTAGMPQLSSVNGAFTLVGNPYASVVNWLLLDKTDVSSHVTIYDPTVSGSTGRGQYVSYNGVLDVVSNPSSLINNNIQSGQAFFVETTGSNPSITFRETYKASVFRPVFRTSIQDLPNLAITLLLPEQAGIEEAADGARVYFSKDFSAAIDGNDSYKFTNVDENLAVLRNGKALSIEARNLVTAADSVPLKIWQLAQKSYKLKIVSENFQSNIEGYLEDKYLKTATPLRTGENVVPFVITADAQSKAPDRFKIVFETFATLPVRLTGIKAFEKNKGVQVEWFADSESEIDHYEVERSANGQQFVNVGTAKAKNNPGIRAAYSIFDPNPVTGSNFYRIRSVEKSGEIKLSEVVRVTIENDKNTISVTNNPVTNRTIKLEFDNVLKGRYGLHLITAGGQKVFSTSLSYTGGVARPQLSLPATIAPGVYQLNLNNGVINKTIPILLD